MAKAMENPEKVTTRAERIAREKARLEEYVTIQLMKDNDKYSKPVFVAVNGVTLSIRRGVPVRIKRKFANVIKNSLSQDEKTAILLEEINGTNKKI